MASIHSVVHKKSLAYRMFIKAAEGRDEFLGNKNVGDFTHTVRKYFTGISLLRYLVLVCIEYPLMLIFGLASFLIAPISSIIYIMVRLINAVNTDQLSLFSALIFCGTVVVITFVLGFLFTMFIAGISIWASSGPGWVARFLRNKINDRDIELKIAWENDPDKFPGPVALLKKWILSLSNSESSQITWDNGRRSSR